MTDDGKMPVDMGPLIDYFAKLIAERDIKIIRLQEYLRLAKQAKQGCVCPPTSEVTCQGALCPRRKFDLGMTS